MQNGRLYDKERESKMMLLATAVWCAFFIRLLGFVVRFAVVLINVYCSQQVDGQINEKEATNEKNIHTHTFIYDKTIHTFGTDAHTQRERKRQREREKVKCCSQVDVYTMNLRQTDLDYYYHYDYYLVYLISVYWVKRDANAKSRNRKREKEMKKNNWTAR